MSYKVLFLLGYLKIEAVAWTDVLWTCIYLLCSIDNYLNDCCLLRICYSHIYSYTSILSYSDTDSSVHVVLPITIREAVPERCAQ